MSISLHGLLFGGETFESSTDLNTSIDLNKVLGVDLEQLTEETTEAELEYAKAERTVAFLEHALDEVTAVLPLAAMSMTEAQEQRMAEHLYTATSGFVDMKKGSGFARKAVERLRKIVDTIHAALMRLLDIVGKVIRDLIGTNSRAIKKAKALVEEIKTTDYADRELSTYVIKPKVLGPLLALKGTMFYFPFLGTALASYIVPMAGYDAKARAQVLSISTEIALGKMTADKAIEKVELVLEKAYPVVTGDPKRPTVKYGIFPDALSSLKLLQTPGGQALLFDRPVLSDVAIVPGSLDRDVEAQPAVLALEAAISLLGKLDDDKPFKDMKKIALESVEVIKDSGADDLDALAKNTKEATRFIRFFFNGMVAEQRYLSAVAMAVIYYVGKSKVKEG